MFSPTPNIWRMAQRMGAGGAGGPPLVAGQKPDVYADFVGGSYRAAGAAQTTFAAWLTALGGTFTRASTATYVDNGVVKSVATNVARFPAQNGIRLTGPATNLQLQSQIGGSSIGSWSVQQGTLTAAGITDPMGGANSVLWVPNTAVNAHVGAFYPPGINIPSGTSTYSLFIKRTGTGISPYVLFDPQNAGVNPTIINMATGAIQSNMGNGVGSVVALANGWYLISVTWNGTAANYNSTIAICDVTGNRILAGDGVSGYYLFGAQITNTPFLCDYIPTTTATVTQAADSLSFPFTQTTFSALLGVNGQIAGGSNIMIGGNAPAPIYWGGAGPYSFNTYNNTTALTHGTAVPTAAVGAPYKVMSAGSLTGRSITYGGLVPASDASAFMPAGQTALGIGAYSAGNQSAYGNFSQLAIWNGLVASVADMIYLTGGPAPPSWLPTVSGNYATIYADYVNGNYWANGPQTSFANWLTAIGGTYSRASTATYVDAGVVKSAATNTARFPTSKGIRLTGAATNLVLQSNNFATAPWNAGPTVAKNVTGPDGTANSGWTFTNAGGTIYQSVTTSGVNTMQALVKLGTEPYAFLYGQDSGGGGRGTFFKLSDGSIGTVSKAVGSPAFTQSNASITPLANGWYLISVVNSGPIAFFFFGFSSADGATAGTPGNTGFAYGAQCTATAFPCDYIPTTTATVTQAVDVLNIPETNLTLSALIWTNNHPIITGVNTIYLGEHATAKYMIFNGGTPSDVASYNGSAVLTGPTFSGSWTGNVKAMIAGSASGRSLTANGATPTPDGNALFSAAPTGLELGSFGGGQNHAYGNFSQLAIWNSLVASTSEMQRLTT